MSLDKRLRDQRAAHRAAFEAPVNLSEAEARVIGWQDGGYLVQQGADRRIKQAATNGAIATGSVMAARGRVDGQGARKTSTQDNVLFIPLPKEPGLVMWLDVNWYSLDPNDLNLEVEKAAATRFLAGLLDYFLKGKKTLYTLPSNDPRLQPRPDDPLRQIASDKGITIVEANPVDVSGVYFAPLLALKLNEDGNGFDVNLWTDAELKALKRLAQTHGVLCEGEWEFWVALGYDNSLLRGLGVRSTVTVERYSPINSSHQVQNKKIFREPFEIKCNATGFFAGLKPKEIVATVEGRPTIAYFRSRDLKS